jgi:hypothetical protein
MAAEGAPVLVRHAGGVEELRQLPPGFRFRPTDEELVVQYLRRKALGAPLPAAVIPVVRDLYSLDPWDAVDVPAAPGTYTIDDGASNHQQHPSFLSVLSSSRRKN